MKSYNSEKTLKVSTQELCVILASLKLYVSTYKEAVEDAKKSNFDNIAKIFSMYGEIAENLEVKLKKKL